MYLVSNNSNFVKYSPLYKTIYTLTNNHRNKSLRPPLHYNLHKGMVMFCLHYWTFSEVSPQIVFTRLSYYYTCELEQRAENREQRQISFTNNEIWSFFKRNLSLFSTLYSLLFSYVQQYVCKSVNSTINGQHVPVVG